LPDVEASLSVAREKHSLHRMHALSYRNLWGFTRQANSKCLSVFAIHMH